jgi:phosphatidylserine decarboxylase
MSSIESHLRAQYLAPQRLIGHIAHFFANNENVFLKNYLIKDFLSKYDVNMAEAEEENALAYPSFNAFFTRKLKQNARPLATSSVISPADGLLSQFGHINSGNLIQAKGHSFEANALLGDPNDQRFNNGSFFTIYLAPKDYHCIHLPIAGNLTSMRYVPGRLFSVNLLTAQEIPQLFSRNERLVIYFDTPDYGKVAVVLVGAMIVGSIHTTWHGVVNPKHGTGDTKDWNYSDATHYNRGDKIGHFCLGSTVIVLSERKINFDPNLKLEQVICMGQGLET